MKEKSRMSPEEIEVMLQQAQDGVLAAVDEEERPYAIPLQYLYVNGKIYFHGRLTGKKIDCIMHNSNVCFTIYTAGGLDYDTSQKYACGIHTVFHCIVARGRAGIVKEDALKKEILYGLLKKYVPDMLDKPMNPVMVNKSAVVEITPEEITGKKYEQAVSAP